MPVLSGKVALVTGASRGIGKAIAIALARNGAILALNYRESQQEAESLVREITSTDGQAMKVRGDTRMPGDVDRMLTEVEDRLGAVNILVNNAVYALCKPFLQYTVDEWKDQLAYKGLAYFLTARAVLPGMLKRGEGVIINMMSTTAIKDGSGESAYATTNGAVAALTRALAREYGSQGVRINGVLVTWAENAFDESNPDHAIWLERFALHRVTRLHEIAETVVFLASPRASGITGSLIPVDAGFLC
jgi:3-oxoacyl-[acyl-carrier protein] reductase